VTSILFFIREIELEGLMLLIGKQRILQNVFSIVTYRNSTMKGPISFVPTKQFGQRLIEPFIMNYGMRHLHTHMCSSRHRACQITPLSPLAFHTSLNPRIHSFSVICGLRTMISKLLLKVYWFILVRAHN